MSENNETAIEYCERLYPEMTTEFKNILDEMYDTFLYILHEEIC